MITKLVPSQDIPQTIRDFYIHDSEFLSKYHSESSKGLDACIQSCVDGFKDYSIKDAEMFMVLSDDKQVGFFTLLNDKFLNSKNLYQFFILPEYRTKEIKSEMINLVMKTTGEFKVIAAVYNQNLPVMRFYSKLCKAKIIETVVKDLNVTVFLLKEGKVLWQ